MSKRNRHQHQHPSQTLTTWESNRYINPRDFHIRLKFNGNASKIEFFNFIMARQDADWPYAPPDLKRSSAKDCDDCKAMLYRQASYAQSCIEALAEQINDMEALPGHLGVKVKLWQTGQQCEDRTLESLSASE